MLQNDPQAHRELVIYKLKAVIFFLKKMILLYFQVSPLILLNVISRVLHLFNTNSFLRLISKLLFVTGMNDFDISNNLCETEEVKSRKSINFCFSCLINWISCHTYFLWYIFWNRKRGFLTKRNIWIVNHDDILIRSNS